MSPRHLHIAHPLPECQMCDQPTRRDVYNATGGLCSDCNDSIADINHRLAQETALRPLFPADEL
jgi:hypothetical protein